MKTLCKRVACASALCAAVVSVQGQMKVEAPGAAASAASSVPVGPRVMTPEQRRAGASLPGEIRPERAVTPQISIPLGRSAPGPIKLPTRDAARRTPASPGAIDDAAARCEAQPGQQARAKCRDELATASPKP